jgi:hypothetical protein
MNKFSSNVDPRRFGVGKDSWKNWKCTCGTDNRSYIVKCLMCGVGRELARQANAIQEK